MIILAVEDDLSESVARKLLREAGFWESEIRCLAKRGFGALRAKFGELITASEAFTVVMLTDLDNAQCAPSLKTVWLARRRLPERFVFRIAVREIEAWLLADREAIASFLGISKGKIERDTETLVDPKQRLLDLAQGGKRAIRVGLLPERRSSASQGPEYNRLLCNFVDRHWSSERATASNKSLQRMIAALAKCRGGTAAAAQKAD